MAPRRRTTSRRTTTTAARRTATAKAPAAAKTPAARADGRLTAADMVERLRRHYIDPDDDMPGGVLLTEVELPADDAERLGRQRRIDALWVGFTRSRGQLLDGHEIKVSRSDWLAELHDPAKADGWWNRCHRWWVVAPSEQIVRPAELPDGWGLLVADARPGAVRLRRVAAAAAHDADIDAGLLVQLLKKMDSQRIADARRVRDHVRQQMQQQHAAALTRAATTGAATGRAAEAAEFVAALEQQLGVRILGRASDRTGADVFLGTGDTLDALRRWMRGVHERRGAELRYTALTQAVADAHGILERARRSAAAAAGDPNRRG